MVSTLSLPNLSLIAAVVSCLIQVGAQLFAVVVVVATVTEAPPRSLAMLVLRLKSHVNIVATSFRLERHGQSLAPDYLVGE